MLAANLRTRGYLPTAYPPHVLAAAAQHIAGEYRVDISPLADAGEGPGARRRNTFWPSPSDQPPIDHAAAQAVANVMRRRYPLRMRDSSLGRQVAAAIGPSGSGGPGPSNALAIPAPVLPAPGEWNLGPLNNDTTVWVSRYGGRYHRFYDCEGLANASVRTPIRYGQMVRDTLEGEQVKPLCGYCEERLRLQRR